MGLHSGDTSELFFEDVRVSAADILGGEGQGFANLMNELPRERLIPRRRLRCGSGRHF